MIDKFYRAFEDRHRGSRERIKERQRAYLPFVQPWLVADSPAALDLGCGRGEWLELLSGEGFHARGVDLDEGMLSACRTLGLEVDHGDALAALGAMPDESLAVVSAFHVIEHIDFDVLGALVQEAHRVLRPGGLLILETPNPENLIVASCNFHLDPSHKNPVPPELLNFVVEYAGFVRTKQLRLQESEQLHDPDTRVGLLDVLGGVSPDYAVVAQKACDPAWAQSFDAAFAREYGLTLSELAGRFDLRLVRGEEVSAQMRTLRDEIAQLNDQVHKLANLTRQDRLQFDARLQESQAEMRKVLAQLEAVYSSTSWRLTAPLRWSVGTARAVWCDARPRVRAWVQKGAVRAYRYSWLRRGVGRALWMMPRLRQRLVGFMAAASVRVMNEEVVVEEDDLTPRARSAYRALQSAMASRHKKENL